MGHSSKTFQLFIGEQLASIPDLRFRPMFGGYGIYANDLFFGILHGERLFFRIDNQTRQRYEDRDMSCFITPGGGKALKHYYEVLLDVIEDRLELIEWALESIHRQAT